jgi:mRNA-degrading endonuclease toxin of MazEF toxin-antitoxin module
VLFPYTFDPNYPKGKHKFVLILQEGDYFKEHNTVTVLLSQSGGISNETSIKIEVGTTQLDKPTWIDCTQAYTMEKSIFNEKRVWCAGQLSPEKMVEIDKALYKGLCMRLQEALEKEDSLAERVGEIFLAGLTQGIEQHLKENMKEYLQETIKEELKDNAPELLKK